MIKKVKVSQLRPGIYIHDFDCAWQTGNLILEPTMINSQELIDIMTSWGIKEVYIDTARGLDTRKEERAPIELRLDTDHALHRLAAAEPETLSNIPLREELAVARNIKKQAVSIIDKAMREARQGQPVEIAAAHQLVEKMDQSIVRNRDALVLLTRIRRKYEYTLMHSISVGAYILNYCNFYKMNHDESMALAIGALFHDIGKTRIKRGILNKPGKLTTEEFQEMRHHAAYSADILAGSRGLPSEAYDIALHHHERYNGSGYPHGLKGEQILFCSQLAAIADVYDALTSDRCYKKGIDRVAGLRKIYEGSGEEFNKELAYKFIRSIGVYPLGTCVKLESGRIAVVIGSTENVIKPVVRIFYDEKRGLPLPVHDLDLSHTEDSIAQYEETEKWDIAKMNIFEDDLAAEILPF